MTTPAGPEKPRRGRLTAAERDARLEAIFDAATEVFLEQGFDAASTDEIARRAGSSKTTLYARFPTKSDLFQGLLRRRNEQLRNRATAITLDLDAPPEQTLTRYGTLIVQQRLNEESRRLLALFLSQIFRFPALGAAAWAEGPGAGERLVAAYLRALDEKGTLRIPDIDRATRQLLGALIGWGAFRSCFGLRPPAQDPQTIAHHVEDTVRRFLRSYEP